MRKLTDFFLRNRLFVFIILLAAALRLSYISLNPPSLNWDEVSHGYNAYSILKTGRDEWGVPFPAIFRAYGDYKLPVYIYLTAISEFLFGLTPFAVRLTSALAGIGTVIFTYLLARRLFLTKEVAILSSFLVAIEPWSLFLSRAAFEANLALFFIVSGVYFFVKSIDNSKFLVHSSIFLGLSVWTYNSARLFVPMLLILLIALYRREIESIFRKNRTLIACCLLLIALFFVPMFYQLAKAEGLARYGWVGILDDGAIAQINEARSNSTLPQPLSRLVHNKVTYFLPRVASNWLSHFSADFLFLKGGTHFQFSVPGLGLIYLVNAPFFLLGILSIIRNRRVKYAKLFLAWLVLAPIAASLTREAPHTLRSIVILPMPMVITALGVVNALNWFTNKKLEIGNWKLEIPLRFVIIPIYLLLLFAAAENYLKTYFLDYRSGYSWAWQYGYKEVAGYAKSNYDNYDKIIITKKYGEPHEFFLFFLGWDPQKYRTDPNLIRFYQSGWFWVDRFDKFYFVNDWEIPKDDGIFVLESGGNVKCQMSNVKCLLITSPGNYPSEWKKLETLNFLDGKGAFDIVDSEGGVL